MFFVGIKPSSWCSISFLGTLFFLHLSFVGKKGG
jgi:hypothetical protein